MTTPLPSQLRESALYLHGLRVGPFITQAPVLSLKEAARIAAELEQAADALEAEPWMPIETAPKETEVLVWFGPVVGVKSATYTELFGDDVWFWCVTDGKFDPHPVRRYCAPYPTHWMPLPPPPSAQVAQEGGGVASTTAADDLLETLEDMARQHCHTSAKGETDSGALSTNAQVLRLLAKAGRFRIDREAGRMVIGYWPENDPKLAPGVAKGGGSDAYGKPYGTENRMQLPPGYSVWATDVKASEERGAYTCRACGFRGFWRGGPHCGPSGVATDGGTKNG